jgi:hypothetical protein
MADEALGAKMEMGLCSGAWLEELTERELVQELRELILCRRLRPASCLALSWEEPNIMGYGDNVNVAQCWISVVGGRMVDVCEAEEARGMFCSLP